MVNATKILAIKLRRTLLSGWKQFIALLAIGALAMTLFIGLLSNAYSLSERVEAVYSSGNMADIYVTTETYEAEDQSKIASILNEAGEEFSIENRSEVTALLGGEDSYCVITPSINRDILTISKPIDITPLTDSHTDTNFFLVDEALYEENPTLYSGNVSVSFSVVDMLASAEDLLTEEMLDTLDGLVKEGGTNVFRQKQVSLSFEVTGTMTHPENIANSSYNGSIFLVDKLSFRKALRTLITDNFNWASSIIIAYAGLADDSTYENPEIFPYSNQYLVKLSDTSKLSDLEQDIRDYFAAKEETEGGSNNLVSVTDRSTNPWSIAADTDVAESMQLCYVFPLVFFLVAILVILTTMNQVIVKERSEIGTMKAIGLSSRQILWHYISLTEILVLLACLIGCILGPIIIPVIMGFKYDLLYTLPARSFFVFPWAYALVSVAAFMLIAGFVTFMIARSELKLYPAESMRPKIIKLKKKNHTFIKKPNALSLSVNMAFRNIRVNLGKSMMVIVGVLGCTALCVCGFGIDDTLNHGIDVELENIYTSDIMVSYGYSGSFLDRLEAIEGVEDAEEYSSTVTTISSLDEDGSILQSTSSTLHMYDSDVEHLKITLPESDSECVISHKISETLDLKLGDTIAFTYDGVTYEKTVGSIVDLFASTGVFCHFSTIALSESVYSAAWVDVADGYEVSEVSTRLMDNEFVQSSTTNAETEERIAEAMSGISLITMAVKVFAILLAVVVLYNLSLMNFNDRVREIATMKVLGFSKSEIALSLVLETLFLTLIGGLLGLAVGYPFMYLVLYVNRVPLVDFLYFIFPSTYVISFFISFGVAFLVSGFLSMMTHRVKMVESLKSVE
ncbi:MAG: FtsX-like permease family protein [Bacillota bacterium]|nr:FtsX-like permease family protein [Bacillota bacterium]